jgi:hypothetical protein
MYGILQCPIALRAASNRTAASTFGPSTRRFLIWLVDCFYNELRRALLNFELEQISDFLKDYSAALSRATVGQVFSFLFMLTKMIPTDT